METQRNWRPVRGRRWAIIAAVILSIIVGLVWLRACTNRPASQAEYVAMGSSFAAGPGVEHREVASPFLCMRSASNYAHIFAANQGMSLYDATCSGATTHDVIAGGQYFRTAQLRAVNRNAKLVTITVGGNDVGFIGNLVSEACDNDPQAVPKLARLLGFCRHMPNSVVSAALDSLPATLRAAVEKIRNQAPDAKIVLIDYATVLPDSGTCSQLQLTFEQADQGRHIAKELGLITEQVAKSTQVDLIKASVLTHGHDVCSPEPWVNGVVFPKTILSFGPAAFHPTFPAMQAIAKAMSERIDARSGHSETQKSEGRDPNRSFVERVGSRLEFGGKTYRFGEINIEWLGLKDYGPKGTQPPQIPSSFEVEDALATAEEMGARVVRSQTLGDTIGCEECLEPRPGVFNEAMLMHTDNVIASAERHHLRLIIPFTGDCADCSLQGLPVNTGMSEYLRWFGDVRQAQFYSDPRIVAAYQARVSKILNHVNFITGVAYKDDPTILAWENCNLCSVESHIDQKVKFQREIDPETRTAAPQWIATIGSFIKSIDCHHLYLDNSGFYRDIPEVLSIPSIDGESYEYYPHWSLVTHLHVDSQLIASDASIITGHDKVDMPVEIGWDRTNWFTQAGLRRLVMSLEANQQISGDGFWALLSHAPDHGWQQIPVDAQGWPSMLFGESGEWWALYYTGHETRINGKADMAARAQVLRSHFYAMQDRPAPAHQVPPPPEVTHVDAQGLSWRGSAGATAYSVEVSPTRDGPWRRICDGCLDDEAGHWTHDFTPSAHWVRMFALNADLSRSEASSPVPIN
jgi:mannan endo-1,4-beta-mannosidase